MLPLRLPVVENTSKNALQARIAQINKQKGAFRDVTEQSLLQEINNAISSGQDTVMTDDGEDGMDQSPQDRQTMLWKGREEMLKQLE